VSRGSRRLPRFPPLPTAAAADADLLVRWAHHRDEAAFELLVRRHAPLILGTCRRVLSDPNDADDAFQATFLVLARKAGSVARGEAVAAWLHRVAVRAALRVQADRVRRAVREVAMAELVPAAPTADPAAAELARALDQEIDRLPTRHRTAFVLCCLEGKTGAEAARLLGCPPGTVSSRLTRARERLRDRLTRRGFAPAIVAAVLAGDSLAAGPTGRLVDSTITAALAFSAGRSPCGPPTRPAVVAEGVLRAMTLTRLKLAGLLLVVGLLAAGGLIAGPSPKQDPEQPQPPPQPKAADGKKPPADLPTVRVVRPQPGGLERIFVEPCRAEPTQRADLYAAVPGRVKQVTADLGQHVAAGQVLAEVDAPGLVLDVQQATVGVEQAEGQVREAESRVATARAEVAAAQGMLRQREAEVSGTRANLVNRQKTYERLKDFAKKGVAGQDQVDEAEAQLRTAEAQLDAATAAVETAKADLEVKKGKLMEAEAGVRSAQSNVKAAQVGLERTRIALDQTRVTAPFSGVIARRNCSPGEFVRPADAGGREPLFTLVRFDVLRVVVWVPEQAIHLLQPGAAAEMTFDALPGVKFPGTVARVGFAVDPSNGQVRGEIDLPNADGKVRPGMAGRVILRLGKGPADAVRVPATAVLHVMSDPKTGERRPVVYVVRDGKARLTPVRVGYSDSREAEITGGLTAEDRVVTDARELGGADDVPVRVEQAGPPK
jgi:RND family efflux transporter MFP subunit